MPNVQRQTPHLPSCERLFEWRRTVIPVKAGNKTCADFGWAYGFALVMVCTITEAEAIHASNHCNRAIWSRGVAVRKKAEMRNFRAEKEHCGRIRTSCHACSAADASRCFHCQVGYRLANRN